MGILFSPTHLSANENWVKPQTMIHTTKVVCGLAFSSQTISQIQKKNPIKAYGYIKNFDDFFIK